MNFYPNSIKQAQEFIFIHKSKRPTHPPLVFNNNDASRTFSQKQLSVKLYFKLMFEDHFKNVLTKVNQAIGFLLQNLLPRATPITIYKAFIRPQLDLMPCTIKL